MNSTKTTFGEIMTNSKILINAPNYERDNGYTQDAIKYKKDCQDFVSLEDGTIVRECKYCNWSLICRQIGFGNDGKPIPMESNYLPIMTADGELAHELFCTGMYDFRPLKERFEDDKVS
jgi:hypothetical protein